MTLALNQPVVPPHWSEDHHRTPYRATYVPSAGYIEVTPLGHLINVCVTDCCSGLGMHRRWEW